GFFPETICMPVGAPQTAHALSSMDHKAAFGYRSTARSSNIAASASHNVWVAQGCRSRKKSFARWDDFLVGKGKNRRSKCGNAKQQKRPRQKRKIGRAHV